MLARLWGGPPPLCVTACHLRTYRLSTPSAPRPWRLRRGRRGRSAAPRRPEVPPLPEPGASPCLQRLSKRAVVTRWRLDREAGANSALGVRRGVRVRLVWRVGTVASAFQFARLRLYYHFLCCPAGRKAQGRRPQMRHSLPSPPSLPLRRIWPHAWKGGVAGVGRDYNRSDRQVPGMAGSDAFQGREEV